MFEILIKPTLSLYYPPLITPPCLEGEQRHYFENSYCLTETKKPSNRIHKFISIELCSYFIFFKYIYILKQYCKFAFCSIRIMAETFLLHTNASASPRCTSVEFRS